MRLIFKNIFFAIFIFIFFNIKLFSEQSVFPSELSGIWEGKDRFVFFEEDEIVIFLKAFYGLYIDRAAEPESYSQQYERKRNSATHKTPEHVHYKIFQLKKSPSKDEENFQPDCWEIELDYSKYQKNYVQVAVIDGKMYLNFYIQDSSDKNYYRGNSFSKGFLASEQNVKNDICCLYIISEGQSDSSNSSTIDSQIFDIRYWLTDMDYSSEKVGVTYDDKTFYVDRHIKSGDKIYSSVSGKSKKVRNVLKPAAFINENYIFNQDRSVLITDKEPYLVKLADKSTVEELIQIVNSRNSKN